MAKWSVVIVSAGGGESMASLGRVGRVPTVVRSAEADSGLDASIKALMSRKDILMDLDPSLTAPPNASWDELKGIREARQASALLLLYPIQARSEPTRATNPAARNPREPLAAAFDVLGYGIVFPGDKELSGTYVSANIAPDEADPTDTLEEGDKIPDSLLDVTPSAASA